MIYDIHDLNEAPKTNTFTPRSIRSYARYCVMEILERIALKQDKVAKITVSTGLANTLSDRYSTAPPLVIRSVPAPLPYEGLTPWEKRIDNAILFFGTQQRIPYKLIPEINRLGLELHIYGASINKEQLERVVGAPDCCAVQCFGEYDPNDLRFLQSYKAMVLFCPDLRSLNFRYSLPNKVFQALCGGLVIIVSENFEEINELFSGGTKHVIALQHPSDLSAALNILKSRRSTCTLERSASELKALNRQAKKEYNKILAEDLSNSRP